MITITPGRVFFFVISLLVLSEMAYGLLYSGLSSQIVLFIVISIVVSVFYIITCLIIDVGWGEMPNTLLLLVIAGGIIFRLTVIWIQPVASGDVSRYLWDGKVQVHGFNPYAHSPTDTVLNSVHSGISPDKMDFPKMRTIYPPFAEWVFALSYYLFGENPLGIKLFFLFAEFLTTILFILLLNEMQKPLAYAGYYLLCPLPIMQFMIDAHMDALAFPFVLLFILLWVKRKSFFASISLGFAVITKLLPLLFIPLLLKGMKNRMKSIIITGSLGIILLSYLPYIMLNGSPWESLSAYSSRWYFNGLVFDMILPLVKSNELAHIFVAFFFICWFLFIYSRRCGLLEKIYYVLLGFFLLSATVHPWYITWLALMLPMVKRWSGVAYVTMINLANVVVIDYKAFKIWHLPVPIEAIEYLPVFLFLFWELRHITEQEQSVTQSLSETAF